MQPEAMFGVMAGSGLLMLLVAVLVGGAESGADGFFWIALGIVLATGLALSLWLVCA